MRTTVRLPGDLLRRAKRKAAADGRSLTSLIEDGLRRVLAEELPVKRKRRALPRISAAKGGLMPGVDPTKLSDLDEIDDIERLRHPVRRK